MDGNTNGNNGVLRPTVTVLYCEKHAQVVKERLESKLYTAQC